MCFSIPLPLVFITNLTIFRFFLRVGDHPTSFEGGRLIGWATPVYCNHPVKIQLASLKLLAGSKRICKARHTQ
jgi:hypothetical protein